MIGCRALGLRSAEEVMKNFYIQMNGRMLNPEQTVKEAGIENQSFVMLVPRLLGGMQNKIEPKGNTSISSIRSQML